MQIVSHGIDQFVPNYKANINILINKAYYYSKILPRPRYVRKLFSQKAACWRLNKHYKTESLLTKYKRVLHYTYAQKPSMNILTVLRIDLLAMVELATSIST